MNLLKKYKINITIKISNISFFIIFTMFSGSAQVAKPTVNGKIINNDKVTQIKVFNLDVRRKLIDTVPVTNKNFDFNIDFNTAKILELRANDYKVRLPLFFYEPGLNYELKIDNDQASLIGSENSLQQSYNALLKELEPLNIKLTQISKDTTLSKEELDRLSTKAFKALVDVKMDYIQKHPKSLVSLYLLQDMVKLGRILSYQELKMFFDIVNVKEHKGNSMLAFISNNLKDIENNRIVGKKAPDFSLASPNGKVYGIKSFEGSYTLVDFWASWCAPCRVTNKKIIPLYEKYKDKGFKIVSISFDNDKEKWINAIKEDKIPWVQVSDLKGFYESEIKEFYKVKSLPTTYVLDPEGKVVDQHLKHNELEQLLETIYKN